jgi:hypothetical protein
MSDYYMHQCINQNLHLFILLSRDIEQGIGTLQYFVEFDSWEDRSLSLANTLGWRICFKSVLPSCKTDLPKEQGEQYGEYNDKEWETDEKSQVKKINKSDVDVRVKIHVCIMKLEKMIMECI